MTPVCTLNGLAVSEAQINIPRIGVWHADLRADSFESFTGKAVIQFQSQTFSGTFSRNGPGSNNKLRARVIGGAGALSLLLPPKGYRAVPLKIPLSDALVSCGEKLSLASDTAVLGFTLDAWYRLQMSGAQAVDALLQVVTPAPPPWRVLLDGSIWVGFEYWSPSKLKDAQLLYSEPERGNATIYSVDPVVLPGETLTYPVLGSGTISRKVSYVRHVIRPSFMHTTIYYEDR